MKRVILSVLAAIALWGCAAPQDTDASRQVARLDARQDLVAIVEPTRSSAPRPSGGSFAQFPSQASTPLQDGSGLGISYTCRQGDGLLYGSVEGCRPSEAVDIDVGGTGDGVRTLFAPRRSSVVDHDVLAGNATPPAPLDRPRARASTPLPDFRAPTQVPTRSYARGCAENGSCYGDISRITGRPKTNHVGGYTRRDGTYVRGHYRSR